MILILLIIQLSRTVDLHLTKALFSLDPDNLQLHYFLGLGELCCCSFFYSFSVFILLLKQDMNLISSKENLR